MQNIISCGACGEDATVVTTGGTYLCFHCDELLQAAGYRNLPVTVLADEAATETAIANEVEQVEPESGEVAPVQVPFTPAEVAALVELGCRVLGYNPNTREDRNNGTVAPNGETEFGRVPGYLRKFSNGMYVWLPRYGNSKVCGSLREALWAASVAVAYDFAI